MPFSIPLDAPISPPVQASLSEITPDICTIVSHIDITSGKQVFDSVRIQFSIFNKQQSLLLQDVSGVSDYASLLPMIELHMKSHIDSSGNII